VSSSTSSLVEVKRFSMADVCASRSTERHPFAVLTFQLAGELVADHRGRVELRAGDVHLIPAGDPHRIFAAKNAELWGAQLRSSELDRERFGPLLESFASVAAGSLPRIAIPEPRRAFVAGLFAELADEARHSARMRALRSESLVALLLAEIAEHAPSRPPLDAPRGSGASDVTAQALAFISANARSPISLTDVARAVHRSRSYTADVVRRETGRSVGDWITEVRLDDARRRLEETDELVEIVAERVGYADATHFGRMFKRRFGLAPRAWRHRRP
jgi:AraC-like DNA-binding protein